MKNLALCVVLLFVSLSCAASEMTDKAHLIQPDELVKMLQAKAPKPVILMVGFRVMYAQAHIAGAEFAGPANEERGLALLRDRAKTLPKDRLIVLYCGCCPWSHCPNVDPAFKTLRDLGFSNVKVLYIANNFGQDWMNKGYPIEKGQ